MGGDGKNHESEVEINLGDLWSVGVAVEMCDWNVNIWRMNSMLEK
jgi:hypothetical protein